MWYISTWKQHERNDHNEEGLNKILALDMFWLCNHDELADYFDNSLVMFWNLVVERLFTKDADGFVVNYLKRVTFSDFHYIFACNF